MKMENDFVINQVQTLEPNVIFFPFYIIGIINLFILLNHLVVVCWLIECLINIISFLLELLFLLFMLFILLFLITLLLISSFCNK